MDYNTYLKKEIEKALFIEIGRDIPMALRGKEIILKKGNYPILPKDVVNIAEDNKDGGIDLKVIIDGMVYILGCDKDFKYTYLYKEFFINNKQVLSYLINKIEENKNTDMKKALVYLNAFSEVDKNKETLYNRIIHLMNMFEKLEYEFLEDEIIKGLEEITLKYPDFSRPFYHLGEYYINKDRDKAKIHLRKCLEFEDTKLDANDLLERIKSIEEYDMAIDKVREGKGEEVLKTLYVINENQPDNLDAKYYLAVALRQSDQSQKALMVLKDLSENIERQEVYAEIALNLAALSEFSSAITYFRKALEIKPDEIGIICNIGVCHLSLGEVEEAKKAFSLAHRINPKDEISAQWIEKINSLQ